MSGAAAGAAETTKLQEKKPEGEPHNEQSNQAPVFLEEDDEFEDFPVEDWTAEEATAPGGNTHLWEESWDDDDQNEEFSKQLKEELKKVSGSKP